MTDPTEPHALGAKRNATRRRLIDAANELFREHGYEGTTAAAIARSAGVTERTFFRYFPSKADVLVSNWHLGAEALRAALAASTQTAVVDLVREALHAFAEQFALDVESALQLYVDVAAFVPIVQMMLELEEDLAVGIARRLSRSSEDRQVRVIAYASLGVGRASIRAFVIDPSGPTIEQMIDDGLDELAGLYATADRPGSPAPRRQGARNGGPGKTPDPL